MSQLSVVSRAYDAEVPYIMSFIEHYKKIGVSEFHFVIPSGNGFEFLKRKLNGISDVDIKIHYGSEHNIDTVHGVQNIALDSVESTHILNVDIDEFLNVENANDILGFDYTSFCWDIVPFNNGHMLPGFKDKQVKYLVSKDLCKYLGEHECVTYHKVNKFMSPYSIIHYVYRSEVDIYLKCALSNYNSYQQTVKDNLKAAVNDFKSLPHKYKMAAIYKKIASMNESHDVFPRFYKIDIEDEQYLLKNSEHFDLFVPLQLSYEKYYSRLNVKKLLKRVFASREFSEERRIPHYMLVKFADASLDRGVYPSLIPEEKVGFWRNVRTKIFMTTD